MIYKNRGFNYSKINRAYVDAVTDDRDPGSFDQGQPSETLLELVGEPLLQSFLFAPRICCPQAIILMVPGMA